MLFSTIFLAIASAPLLVSAAPTRFGKRAAADILVYQFADVLEQLETQFYTQALSKFQSSDFTTAGFSSPQLVIEQFQAIQNDESTHASTLEAALAALGAQPITSCKFNFDSVLTDVATMAATARVVENVGVAAYLGGATLMTDPVLLDAAASILTVEARHQTILNIVSGTGTSIPNAFDIPLTPSEVLAIAGGFFDGPCDVGIPANPSLSLTNTGSVSVGTSLSFSSPAINSTVDTSSMFCQMLIGGQPFSIALPMNACVVPAGVNGPVAIFITSDGQPLVNNVRDRATTQLVAGPTMAFIDTQPQLLGQLVTGAASNTSGASSSSTATISPAEASAIISSAGSAASASATVTGSSVVASATSTASATSNNASSGGPNMYTGPAANGAVVVNGWSTTSS